MAKDWEIEGISARTAFAEAGATVVETRAAELIAHSDGVLDTVEIERRARHARRHAASARRARGLRPLLPAGSPAACPQGGEGDCRRARRAPRSRRRDRLALRRSPRSMPAPDRPGIVSLVERFRAEQLEANAALAPFVEPQRLERLHAVLVELVAAARAAVPGSEPAQAALLQRLERPIRPGRSGRESEAGQGPRSGRAAGRGRGADGQGPARRAALASCPRRWTRMPPSAQHDMRIAAKRLRYVLEATGFCFGKPAAGARRAARDLQDLLGEIHDVDVMLPRLAEHRRSMRDEDAARRARGRGCRRRPRPGPGGTGAAPDRLPRSRGLRGLPARPPRSAARALPRALPQPRAACCLGQARPGRRCRARVGAGAARGGRAGRNACGPSWRRPSAPGATPRKSAAGCSEALAEAERQRHD